MITRVTINRLNATALLCLGVFFIFSVLNALVGESGGWPEYLALGGAAVLALIAGVLRLRRRAELQRSIKSSRDSLLKHLWESRHKREW